MPQHSRGARSSTRDMRRCANLISYALFVDGLGVADAEHRARRIVLELCRLARADQYPVSDGLEDLYSFVVGCSLVDPDGPLGAVRRQHGVLPSPVDAANAVLAHVGLPPHPTAR